MSRAAWNDRLITGLRSPMPSTFSSLFTRLSASAKDKMPFPLPPAC